jgi:hypothetical protein
MRPLTAAALIATTFATSTAGAESATATLAIMADVTPTISITIQSAGGAAVGLGTGAATTALGAVSRVGSPPPGFSIARAPGNYRLSSTIAVLVEAQNLASPDYTLTAQLGSLPAQGIAWKVGGQLLSDGAAATLTSTGAYGITAAHAWEIVVNQDAPPGALDNAILFTATAN